MIGAALLHAPLHPPPLPNADTVRYGIVLLILGVRFVLCYHDDARGARSRAQ